MKLLITILLAMTIAFTFGQEMYQNRKVDTLKIVEAKRLKDINFKYVRGKNEVGFSKSVTIETLHRFLAEMKADLDNLETESSWSLEDYQQYERVLKYMESKKSLKLSSPWENESIQRLEQIDKNISLFTAEHFYLLACQMLDNGYFYVQKDGKQIKRLIKAEVYEWDDYGGTTSIKYLLPDGEELWMCPPIIIDHFVND